MSVLSKVKEKAKKLKLSLSGKKGHDENDPTAHLSVVGPKDKGEEDAVYHSARSNAFSYICNLTVKTQGRTQNMHMDPCGL